MFSLRWFFAMLALVAVGSGCFPTAAYLRDQQSAVDTIGQRYIAYVLKDPALSQEEKEDRIALIAAWRARIESRTVDARADLATHDAIATEYRTYLAADSVLSDAQRQAFEFNLQTWKLLIDKAIKAGR